MKKLFAIASSALLALGAYAGEPFAGLSAYEDSYLVSPDEVAQGSGVLTISSTCLRPKGNRQRPYPQSGDRLVTNPPTFTWPMADYEFPATFPVPPSDKGFGDYLTYDFQLSRDADFSGPLTASESNLPLAFCNVHTPLTPGTWYWRYRVSGQKWSEPYQVTVSDQVPLFPSPSAEQAAAMIPASHPFIYKPLEENPARSTRDRKTLVKNILRKADKSLTKTIDSFNVKGADKAPTGSESERQQIEKFRLRYRIEPMCKEIANLLLAYRLTQNDAYLGKALEFADYVSRQDPARTYALSDFTGSRSMMALAQMIDVAADKLGDERIGRYSDFIAVVGRGIMATAMRENVGSADGILFAHFFQHTFNNIFTTAIIMMPHLDEAHTWFNALYDIWLSRSPGGGYLADGVWPNGNIGYIHVNMSSMVENMLIYRNLFGVNLFDHPWYHNCADALAYVVPAESAGDGFGDDSEHVPATNSLRPDFAYILGCELNNPFAIDYARDMAGIAEGAPYVFTKDNFQEYRLESKLKPSATEFHGHVPNAAVFPETGIAVMHTDLTDHNGNLFLSFRSSPFGVGSHGMAEQNSFNLSYGGKPIFYPTGYKITTTDKHYLLSHKNSRARNTITVDGKTQAYSHSAYGWIARFINGNDITYALGDASHAYVPFDISALNWETVLRDADSYTSEKGFILNDSDDPKVKKFRRHIAMLRPGIIVIYDDLEADKAVTWTSHINGLERSNMTLDKTHNVLTATTDNSTATATVTGSSPITAALADTSLIKPHDWLNPQRGRPAKQFEARQYHSTFENATKQSRMRYLTIIRVNNAPADDYTINAELDTNKEARLEIINKRTGESLLAGPTINAGYAADRRYPLSTLLRTADGQLKESPDRLPLMALPE